MFLAEQLDLLHQLNLDIGRAAGPLRAACFQLGVDVGDEARDIPPVEAMTEAEALRLTRAAITRADVVRTLALSLAARVEQMPKAARRAGPDADEGQSEA